VAGCVAFWLLGYSFFSPALNGTILQPWSLRAWCAFFALLSFWLAARVGQYLLEKPGPAGDCYRAYLKRFEKSGMADKAMYSLAYILGRDLQDCAGAIKWYNRLENDFPRSGFLGNAMFWRADCFTRLGRISEAEREYRKYMDKFPGGQWVAACRERLAK
jgi:TolA-binding protein